MSDAYYWFYLRIIAAAAAFIFMISWGIYAATRRTDLVRKYCGAHLIALILGTITDVALVKYVLSHGGGFAPAYMNAIFLAPIVFFVGFSVYICRGDVLHAHDVLIPVAPIVAWGFLILFGWQGDVGDYDVLGAWFVTAGCGGVDIAAAFGAPALTRRPYSVKAVGYLIMLAAVYVVLPAATR